MNLSALKNQWLPISKACVITHKPQRFMFLGEPVVLYRVQAQIVALQDRCPHRGIPLSKGTVQGELLQCAYHGWRFNPHGECVAIPGLCKPIDLAHKRVPAFATQVYLGVVFICLQPDEQTQPLYAIPALETKAYAYHTMEFSLQGNALNIIENVLDATHTHFVHAGLLRHDKKRQPVTAKLCVDALCAQIRYEDETKQSGWVSSLLERDRNYSIGRFHFPLIAELEYHGAKQLTAAFTFFLSPINASNEHRVFAFISYKNNWLTNGLKKLMLLPFLKLALKQDRAILKAQEMNAACFPDLPFKSTELDILRAHIERIVCQQSTDYEKVITLNL